MVMLLRLVSPVPLAAAKIFWLFRNRTGFKNTLGHCRKPKHWPDPLPVRLHSAFSRGPFGSLKCDCGEQLLGSMKFFEERGRPLYLAQEGRGID